MVPIISERAFTRALLSIKKGAMGIDFLLIDAS